MQVRGRDEGFASKSGGRGEGRIPVALACSECKARNYKTTKRGTETGVALEIRKYCKVCKRHTMHRETK
jgi:large subunit ribosomal protein L33